MHLLSIIIPVFNTKIYLRNCIDSVLNQNLENFEIILINDCSTDGSKEICDSYKNNKNVKIIHNRINLGAGLSRNKGIKASKGKYLIFLDSDDFLFKNTLRNIEKVIQKKSVDLIITRFKAEEPPYSNDYLFKKKFLQNDVNEFLKHINRINYQANVCWHYIIKKDLIKKNRVKFLNAKLNEDQEFVTKILCSMKTFDFYKDYYYWHRERPGSLNRSIDLHTTKSFILVLYELSRFLKRRNWSKQKKIFIKSQIKSVIVELSSRLTIHSKKDLITIVKFLNNYSKKFELLGFKNLNFLRNRKKKLSDLIKFRENFSLSVLNKLNNYDLSKSKIFIYCASIYGIAIFNILKKNNYNMIGLVDDNRKLSLKKINNILVKKPYILNSALKKFNNIFVIVCAQVSETYKKIHKNLSLRKNKILFFNYE